MDKTPAKIGDQLTQFLASSGLTQEALEKKTGIPQAQISRVCRGQFERITANVRLLCKFAKIPLSEGFRGPAAGSRIVELVDSIVAGSVHRERLMVKLLETGELLASSDAVPLSKSRSRRRPV